MAITAGQKLGPYEVLSLLGKGGMGEVYRARDTKLDRDVAVKTLPEEFSRDTERLARFEREAKLLASLNHSNIGAIHGIEESNGTRFLVLELIEGETLADLIHRGPIPVEESLKLALQIAEALEAAHEKGVLHRDLKPANIKVTPDGKVKVLDFGLAKTFGQKAGDATLSNSPTISIAATNAGVILGTAGYMAPEQARGTITDQRSDVFSFGCVLYEMLTAQRAFTGNTVSDVLASVLAKEPDFSLIPINVHSRVVELIRRCLVKEPRQRWHAMADIRVEVETILSQTGGLAALAASRFEQPPLWKRLATIALTAMVGAVITAIAIWNLQLGTRPPDVRFSFALPPGQEFERPGRHVLAVSAQTGDIVYAANDGLYVKRLSDLAARPIEGATNLQINSPFFSPDGQWVAFWSASERQLKKISVAGGTPLTLSTIDNPFGGSWTEDNMILVGQGSKGIVRVSANQDMPPETIIDGVEGELMHNPQLLPDGEHVLFTVTKARGEDRWDNAQIVVQSLESRERKTIVERGADARFVPIGYLVYALGTTLYAAAFDTNSLALSGPTMALIEGVMRGVSPAQQTGAANFGFSDSGTMVYVMANGAVPLGQPFLVDATGARHPVAEAGHSNPDISHDGKYLATQRDDGQIYIHDLSGAVTSRKLTFDGTNRVPMWTQDRRIVFNSDREGDSALYWQDPFGGRSAERLTTPEPGESHFALSITPDGKTMLFRTTRGNGDIWQMAFEDRVPKPLIEGEGDQYAASVSFNGRWIAYESLEKDGKNQWQIYVQPFPPTGAKYQVTTQGAGFPLWSPAGPRLFFLEGVTPGMQMQLVSVDVQTGPGFPLAMATRLPFDRIAPAGAVRRYDVTPDGKRFVIMLTANGSEQPPRPTMQVTLNWFEELKRLVPVP